MSKKKIKKNYLRFNIIILLGKNSLTRLLLTPPLNNEYSVFFLLLDHLKLKNVDKSEDASFQLLRRSKIVLINSLLLPRLMINYI